MIKYTSYIEGMHKSANEEISMEVKLIAMTDAMYNGKPSGSLFGPEQVCNHSAKTCTSEDAGTMMGTWYVDDERIPVWNDLDMKPLRASLRSGHESVLEHAVYTFEVKGVSRALTHQLVRHRVASYSQQSQRYVKMDGFKYVMPDSIRNFESKALDDCIYYIDGTDPYDCEPVYESVQNAYKHIMEEIESIYTQMVRAGIPEEDARYILPNACTTNIIVTMNARQLRKFFMLRVCSRSQWEIRELASRMLKICKEVSPTIFENAGASCDVLGYCPEQRSCGRCPQLKTLLDKSSTT